MPQIRSSWKTLCYLVVSQLSILHRIKPYAAWASWEVSVAKMKAFLTFPNSSGGRTDKNQQLIRGVYTAAVQAMGVQCNPNLKWGSSFRTTVHFVLEWEMRTLKIRMEVFDQWYYGKRIPYDEIKFCGSCTLPPPHKAVERNNSAMHYGARQATCSILRSKWYCCLGDQLTKWITPEECERAQA